MSHVLRPLDQWDEFRSSRPHHTLPTGMDAVLAAVLRNLSACSVVGDKLQLSKVGIVAVCLQVVGPGLSQAAPPLTATDGGNDADMKKRG
eukprot:8345120-Alexandrium_andersonii.AAC.1